MGKKKVWFITGASKGLGLSLVHQLLNAGQYVAATSRNVSELKKAVNNDSGKFLPLAVNLADEQSVEDAIKTTITKFERIDVVINNAGYGIGGSIEELSDAETRNSFDVNVFGTLNVIRKASPYLRAQRAGHIINIASIAGIAGATGWAVYAAAKSAVIALSEVSAEDLKEFGIKVTVVAPGAFRTSFLTTDSLILAANPIAEYEEVRAIHSKYLKMDGQQIGDPEKAAAAMISLASMPNPPLHLLLGNDAFQRANNKLESLQKEFRDWKAITISTDFDEN
ncbi:3-oxoacyl-[acyl-carrier-protein] reductase FabG [Pedobacter sp. Bi27]|uniref:SDR family NAD(P)-dependent oxidoreductase n=1 Tax=unclassified Pedobacter TaxID=2628915 RepID=UPI001DA6636A|nr:MULTISPECIES: SDR family NAD(P)-dependent oxidoreductase [unclassified Pedobacter]CAH0151736.1 3-oxoacyl-[acyl-carrier-protein] reductase FabG [Pedobacter sp. Bi36]CAH0207871.1 3-oxoacyl-[acyl-carrier-protein] reductase FabG [Pedobacter sp. Bi126]CAH0265889.1 3-oxoacyl-[acyl-carrier-protein] reductase FabG [Pedobacter sp. Bi27]